MREHRLTSSLRRIYGSAPTDMGDGKALEADLLARYRKLHPKNRRWLVLLNPWSRAARFGFAGLAGCLLVIGACATDTITEVEVGKQVIMNLKSEVNADVDVNIHQLIYMVLDSVRDVVPGVLKAQPGVEDVSVSTSIDEDGERNVSVRILIFGPDLDGDGLVNTLRGSVPSLSRAAVTVNDLRTTYSESLASKVGRTLLRLKGGRPDSQELRRHALEELDARR